MSKYIRVKNIVIVALCITVVIMAAGYIILAIEIDKLQNVDSVFDVSFTNVKQISSIKGGSAEPSGSIDIQDSGKSLKMNFILNEVHDEIDYEITIQNRGTMDVALIDLIMSPDFTDFAILQAYDPISISLSTINGRILEPDEEATVKLSVFYNPVSSPSLEGMKKISGKVGILAESISSK